MNANEPVSPIFWPKDENYSEVRRRGLTKRELIAAMALQGMMADPAWKEAPVYPHATRMSITEWARITADALLVELERTQPK